MEAEKYYVIQWFPDTKHFYFIGQQQSHAMVKLVDTVPTGDHLAAEKKEENWKDRIIKEEGSSNGRSSYAFSIFRRNFQCF